MKGIYLSEEGKKDIEDRIAELESREINRDNSAYIYYTKKAYQNILSTAVVLPVYESLGDVMHSNNLDDLNGVIIQPKNK